MSIPKVGQPVLLSFALFSTIVSVADLWVTLIGPKWMKAELIQYTSWLASGPYLFCSLFAWYPLLTGGHRRRMRLPLLGSLLMGIWSGYSFYQLRGQDFGNPYLRVSRWQPIWTMAIPAMWAVIILLPSGRRSDSQEVREPSNRPVEGIRA